jgi:hypothetical protein
MANYVDRGFLEEAIAFHGILISKFASKMITRYIPTISAGKWSQKKR